MKEVMVRHRYVSTACQHDLHDRCRKTCKFCAEPCLCPCHENEQPPRPGEPLDGTNIDVVLTTPAARPTCRGCGWEIGELHAVVCALIEDFGEAGEPSNRSITAADCAPRRADTHAAALAAMRDEVDTETDPLG